jgi:hypothetical protein
MIRAALAIKLAELATARKNHGFEPLQQRHLPPNWPLRAKNRALAQTRQTITPRGIVERAFSCSASLCAQCA